MSFSVTSPFQTLEGSLMNNITLQASLQVKDLNVLPTLAAVNDIPCVVISELPPWQPPAPAPSPSSSQAVVRVKSLVEPGGLTTLNGKIYNANGTVSIGVMEFWQISFPW